MTPILIWLPDFGGSYAIDIATYGLSEKVFKMKPLPAYLTSAGVTLLIGIAYKGVELVHGGTTRAFPAPWRKMRPVSPRAV